MTPSKVRISESGIKWYKSMVPISIFGMATKKKKKKKKFFSVMFNVKVFATQDGPASRTNMTYYIDPCGTHTDQKALGL